MDAIRDFQNDFVKCVVGCLVVFVFVTYAPFLSRIRISLVGDAAAAVLSPGSAAAASVFNGPDVSAMTPEEESVNALRTNYIDQYSAVAIAEQRKFGIPASITLAQGLIESAAGTSKLTRKTNNHFGIKCFSKRCRSGHCYNFTDDTHKDFFLNFPSAWQSYRAHSLFLKNAGRYSRCFDCGTDYACWADQLQACGYATADNYASGLKRVIQLYRLDRFDSQ